jgi:hypothetical protein
MRSILALLIMIATSVVQAADAGACYTISNADSRAFCLARARGEPSMCYAIQAADMRAACLAEVRSSR